MRSRGKYLTGGAIILAVMTWLVLSNLRSASTGYLTVGQARAAGPSPRLVRVSGLVVGASIDWRPQELALTFELADDSGRLRVRYHGAQPDMFRDGAQAVVEGKIAQDGVFEASSILMKCPSKYVEDKK